MFVIFLGRGGGWASIIILSMGGWGHAPPGNVLYFGFSEIVSDPI